VPFKLNQDRRHHIPKQKHRVTNWPAYDAALRSRTDPRRASEVAIAVEVLNRVLALGRPNYVRIA
jgi:hypothetical protein